MKTPFRHLYFIAMVVLLNSWITAFAQTNSWTNSVSGNWQDAYWSLGLPTTNQDVSLTNAGSKTLSIGPATAQNFPETLTLNSLTISSPDNSYNTLLMNFAGTNTPLAVQSITVASNSEMRMLSSALLLNGPNSVGMQVGGRIEQDDSLVVGRQVNVGYIGPGIYNLNSGFFAVSNLWVGGDFAGVFNQNGGTNNSAIVALEAGGTYNLSDGDFSALVYFDNDANRPVFHQTGGRINRPLSIFQGTYLFDGGINSGIVAPIDNGVGAVGDALVVQSGGTNFALDLGSYGTGNYVLSNGYSCLSNLNIGLRSTFHQFGGTQILTNGLILASSYADVRHEQSFAGGTYWLSGGTFTTPWMMVNYYYHQDGGTNLVAGDINLSGYYISPALELDGGVLSAQNLNAQGPRIIQNGGLIVITNQLTIQGGGQDYWYLPTLEVNGGQLVVSNILISEAIATFAPGTLSQSGTLTLRGSILVTSAGSHQFGSLLSVGSFLVLPSNAGCTIRFGDSSEMPTGGALTITNWSGSLYGGGQHRIIFGTNAAALTSGQLDTFKFQDPAGLAPGTYPARILATGEIVPDTGAPLPPVANLVCATNGLMHLSIGGDIGRTYAIEVSTDLVHWNTWTDQFNTSGTMSLDDNDSTNCPQRFYRAQLVP
jgi:hypothetical protein